MTPPKKYPNADKTRVLHMRINPDGRLFKLHPKDLDIEHYVETHGGKATVKLQVLLSRDKVSVNETNGRDYHKVLD